MGYPRNLHGNPNPNNTGDRVFALLFALPAALCGFVVLSALVVMSLGLAWPMAYMYWISVVTDVWYTALGLTQPVRTPKASPSYWAVTVVLFIAIGAIGGLIEVTLGVSMWGGAQ